MLTGGRFHVIKSGPLREVWTLLLWSSGSPMGYVHPFGYANALHGVHEFFKCLHNEILT